MGLVISQLMPWGLAALAVVGAFYIWGLSATGPGASPGQAMFREAAAESFIGPNRLHSPDMQWCRPDVGGFWQRSVASPHSAFWDCAEDLRSPGPAGPPGPLPEVTR